MSLVTDGTEQRHTLGLSGEEGPTTLRLDGAPSGLSLDGMEIVVAADFEGTYRNTDARVIAEDAIGRADTFYVHIVDLSAPINPITIGNEAPVEPLAVMRARVYPNPAHADAQIELQLAAPSEVVLTLYDLRGRRVSSYSYGRLASGAHTLPVDLSALPRGTYLFEVAAGESMVTGRIIRG